MTALATTSPAASWAPPRRVDKNAAIDRVIRLVAALTYQGSAAQTRWGPVQVQITVQSGKITKVTILQEPNGNRRDAEINDQAVPILIDETIQAQSANIDMVSGATVTSEGYVESLQAAIDEAGI